MQATIAKTSDGWTTADGSVNEHESNGLERERERNPEKARWWRFCRRMILEVDDVGNLPNTYTYISPSSFCPTQMR